MNRRLSLSHILFGVFFVQPSSDATSVNSHSHAGAGRIRLAPLSLMGNVAYPGMQVSVGSMSARSMAISQSNMALFDSAMAERAAKTALQGSGASDMSAPTAAAVNPFGLCVRIFRL